MRTVLADGRLSTRVVGVRNGASYTVKVRALNAAGHGVSSEAARTRTAQWFRDPLSAATRSRQVAVPNRPNSYRGPLRHTRATARSHDGTPAMSGTSPPCRQLQSGQAATVRYGPLFSYNSAVLSAGGRTQVKSMVRSMKYVKAVTCEGNADFGGRKAWEAQLAKKRAAVVCQALRSYGAKVTTAVRGYGATSPSPSVATVPNAQTTDVWSCASPGDDHGGDRRLRVVLGSTGERTAGVAVLATWLDAACTGHAGPDDLADVVRGHDPRHLVAGLPRARRPGAPRAAGGGGGPVSLALRRPRRTSWAWVARRRSTWRRSRQARPWSRGPSGWCPRSTRARSSGGRTRPTGCRGSTSARPRASSGSRSADVTRRLVDLDVASWQPEIPDLLMNLRHRPPLPLPPGLDPRRVETVERAVLCLEIVELARSGDGGAVSAYEMEHRRDGPRRPRTGGAPCTRGRLLGARRLRPVNLGTCWRRRPRRRGPC